MTRVILNGFYRSGTSILWRALQRANPDRVILYEPCHPDLSELVTQAASDPAVNDLHGFRLWDEYIPHLDRLADLRAALPRGQVFAQDGAAVAQYAQGLFEGLGADVLQVNRWHYVLAPLVSRTGAAPVHILRNPVDIYRSFVGIFQGHRPQAASAVLRGVAPNYLPPKSWDMLTALQQAPGHPGLDRLRGVHPVLSRQGFDVVLAVWIVTNAAALRACQQLGGQVWWIEDIVAAPQAYIAAMDALGFGTDATVFNPEKVGQLPDAAVWADFKSRADRYGLSDDLALIRQTCPAPVTQ